MSSNNGKVEVLWPDDDDVVPLGPGQIDAHPDRAPAVCDRLTSEWAVRPAPQPPARGLRRLLHMLLGGAVEIPPSPRELRRRELVAQVRTPIAGCHKIAFVSRKGGVGKTTTCLLAGHTFASLRGDRVVALDASPDSGTLGDRLPRETSGTVAALVRDRELLVSYADVREYTTLAPSRLEVIAGDEHEQALGGVQVEQAVELLERHFNLVCIDTGAGVPGSAAERVLDLADRVVVVGSASLDVARAASSTLDWLEQHGHGRLAASAVTVLNAVPATRRRRADVDRIAGHFASRCRACVRIPWDPHLETGAVADLEGLRPATRGAFLEFAAVIACGFSETTEGRS